MTVALEQPVGVGVDATGSVAGLAWAADRARATGCRVVAVHAVAIHPAAMHPLQLHERAALGRRVVACGPTGPSPASALCSTNG